MARIDRVAVHVALSAGLALGLLALLAETEPAKAAFPGQNGKIVFTGDRGNASAYIFSMNPDGSGQARLTDGRNSVDGQPKVSPNGEKIVFTRPSSENGNIDVYVMDTDGKNQDRLTHHPHADKQPAWSPNGKKIVFVSLRDGNQELYTMDANGSEETRITRTGDYEYFPEWSPDGTTIAYSRSTVVSDGSDAIQIFASDPDGADRVRLTNNDSENYDLSWSPGGNRIAFTRDPARTFLYEDASEVWVMNAKGKNEVRLTKNAVEDSEPAFSPSGNKIAFTSARNGRLLSIYKMDADGSNKIPLTKPRENYGPDWGVKPTQGGSR